MERGWKEYPCADCGTPVVKRTRKGGVKLCVNCAVDRIARANRALHAKDTASPVYQRWLSGCRAAAHRTAQG